MAPGITRRVLPLALLLASATLATAADASAQLPSALRDGRRALSFGVLTSGGGMLGYSLMTSSRNAFTIDFAARGALTTSESTTGDVVDGESDQFFGDITVAPGFRRYMAARGDVVSYVGARALLGFQATIHESTAADGTISRSETWSPLAGVAGGFGLEWFVTDEMSLRGEMALDATYEYRKSSNAADREQTTQTIRAGVDRSAIVFSIWF